MFWCFYDKLTRFVIRKHLSHFKAVFTMAENCVECFLVPQKGLNFKLGEQNFPLPNLEEVILGRGAETGIMELTCSKQQLTLEADTSARQVKIKRIGRNPSLLAGFPMEQNQVYIGREGMSLHITPAIEFTITFKEQNKVKRKTADQQIFEESLLRSQQIKKFIWGQDPTGKLIHCQTNDVTFTEVVKVASFDLDGTIILTKTGYTFPKDDDDWKLWHPTVKTKLKDLVREGYSLVLFTNQNGLDWTTKTRLLSFKSKIENIIKELEVPFSVFIAVGRDLFRKPAPGMWDYLVSKVQHVDMDSSFFVGDAAGRLPSKPVKGDFDITDRLFARNIGLKFLTPEEFFLKESPRPFKDVSFHPHQLPSDNYPELNLAPNPPEVIVLVGSPASGKSYFAKHILESAGYVRVSRDDMGQSWPKCRDKLIDSIKRGKNAVYDATNPDKASRKGVVDVCNEMAIKVNIRCFVMTTTEERCEHNNKFRQLVQNSNPVPQTALVSFGKKFEEPTLDEGFKEVVKIPFVPKFDNLEHERLYSKYLLGRGKKK